MKAFLCLALFVAAVFAEDKQPEKRAVLGYGGYGGYAGLPAYTGLPAVAASTYHGIGAYPYSGYSGLPYTHAGIHAPAIIPKVAAPLAYSGYPGYASALHAPIVAKTISPYGYSSPYLGYAGHGLPLYH